MNEAARLEEAAAVAKTTEAFQQALVAQHLLYAAPSLVLHEEGSQGQDVTKKIQPRLGLAEADLWLELAASYGPYQQQAIGAAAIDTILNPFVPVYEREAAKHASALAALRNRKSALAKSTLLSTPLTHPDESHASAATSVLAVEWERGRRV